MGKIKAVFRKIYDYIEGHAEYARYMLPCKEISSRFKFLNFVSADWLRITTCCIRYDVERARTVLNAVNNEEATREELFRAAALASRWLDRADAKIDGIFTE